MRDECAFGDVATPRRSAHFGAERENAPRARRVSWNSGARRSGVRVFVYDKDAREAPDLRAPQDASPGPPASGDSPSRRSGGSFGRRDGPRARRARDAPPVFLKFPIDAALTRNQPRAPRLLFPRVPPRARVAMASRAFAADEVPLDFDAEEAMRAELEALGEDVCSSEEERFAEDGAGDENARGAAGDPARSPPVGRAWGWDRDPVEDVQRAWSRREARLRRNSASRGRLGDDDDEFSPDAPRDDDAPASSASASSGDETSSEGETRETRAAFLRAYEARERARAQERESRRAAARRDEEAAETGAEAERAAAAARAEAEPAPETAPETAPDVFELRPEGLPSSAGTDVSDAAEPRVPERTRAARALCAPASEAAASEEVSAAAALAIQSRWRGVAVRRRLRARARRRGGAPPRRRRPPATRFRSPAWTRQSTRRPRAWTWTRRRRRSRTPRRPRPWVREPSRASRRVTSIQSRRSAALPPRGALFRRAGPRPRSPRRSRRRRRSGASAPPGPRRRRS